MSETLAFLHQKGGTGKTTLAIAAAYAYAQAGRAVLLLDLDYQGTASAWGDRFAARIDAPAGGGIEVRSLVGHDVAAALNRFADGFEVVVVDAPPTLSELSTAILHAVRRVIVPTRPAWPDVWALATVAGLAAQPGVSARVEVVFNQVDVGDDVSPFRAEIETLGLPVSAVEVPRDPAFADLFRTGWPGPRALASMNRLLELK